MIEFERRKIERFPLRLSTYLSIIGGDKNLKYLKLVSSNISSEDAYFETEKPLSVETEVKLDIIIPLNVKGKVLHIEVSASVIRTDQQGMAICFDKEYKIASSL